MVAFNRFSEFLPFEINYNNRENVFVFVPIEYYNKNGYLYNIQLAIQLPDSFVLVGCNKYKYIGDDVVEGDSILNKLGYTKNERIILT